MTSANTRRLLAHRFMTPLLMTTSAELSSIGKSSITPCRNSTLRRPIAAAVARDRPRHFLGHVDANDAAVRPDLTQRDKAVETASGAEIDHALAGLQDAERERVTDTGKSLDGAVG